MVGEKKRTLSDKSIFIVHGRDDKPVQELKLILLEIGLNPIVLHEQPGGSRTIVEKIEKYSGAGFVFVILTQDDVGGTVDSFRTALTSSAEAGLGWEDILGDLMNFRARQNVILEFGYFMGLLGRDRVCCLYKGEIELPSDIHGIVYMEFKDSVNEKRLSIMKELKEAGYRVNI